MSKKSLIVLSICLVMAAGIAVYVWANGCCEDPYDLCNPSVEKDGQTECDYEFNVDLEKDCVTGSTVKVHYKKTGGGPRSIG